MCHHDTAAVRQRQKASARFIGQAVIGKAKNVKSHFVGFRYVPREFEYKRKQKMGKNGSIKKIVKKRLHNCQVHKEKGYGLPPRDGDFQKSHEGQKR